MERGAETFENQISFNRRRNSLRLTAGGMRVQYGRSAKMLANDEAVLLLEGLYKSGCGVLSPRPVLPEKRDGCQDRASQRRGRPAAGQRRGASSQPLFPVARQWKTDEDGCRVKKDLRVGTIEIWLHYEYLRALVRITLVVHQRIKKAGLHSQLLDMQATQPYSRNECITDDDERSNAEIVDAAPDPPMAQTLGSLGCCVMIQLLGAEFDGRKMVRFVVNPNPFICPTSKDPRILNHPGLMQRKMMCSRPKRPREVGGFGEIWRDGDRDKGRQETVAATSLPVWQSGKATFLRSPPIIDDSLEG
ncbi:hypothetical protein QBC35DRAFT_470649 [Podospora australis]|uniref:Uncharacterized protein n=1 Tax=Podospora australis TaxID=1536484 RepID=A0AAN6X1J4_9PEZI|nr:hypothetical protein QBC35DRAFT_470649 [Podospora australis]